MKRLFLISLALVLVNKAGNAQDAVNPQQLPSKVEHKQLSLDERVKQNSAKAEKELLLNTDQKLKWETASRQRMEANEPLRKKLEGSTTPQERKEIRGQMKINNDNFDKAVNAFLNDNQKIKFQTLKKEKHKGKKGKERGDESDQNPPIIQD
jgi:hypothetical protein